MAILKGFVFGVSAMYRAAKNSTLAEKDGVWR